jgi:hypothetical protein
MKPFYRFLILLIHLGTNLYCEAQQSLIAKHNVYVELLGPGDLYSLNEELRISQNQSIRFGISWFQENWYNGGKSEKQFIRLPLSFQNLWGQTSHKLEVSAGLITQVIIDNNKPNQLKFSPDLSAGYRYQSANGGFFLAMRGYLFFPWFLSVDNDDWIPYAGKHYLFSPGIAIGWSFNK